MYVLRLITVILISREVYRLVEVRIKVKDLLQYIGGNTKILIGDCFNKNNKFIEKWRGKVDYLDWDNIPCGDRYIEHITVAEGEDILQIWV